MKSQYFKILIFSFFSTTGYKHAIKYWQGFGLRYFLIVNLVISALICFSWMLEVQKAKPAVLADNLMSIIVSDPELTFEENITRFFNLLQQLPNMKIQRGKLVTDAAQPLYIVDPTAGYDIAIIDTSGKHMDLSDTDANILLTNQKIIIRSLNHHDQEHSLYFSNLKNHLHVLNNDEENINNFLYILRQIPPFTMKYGQILTTDNKTSDIRDINGNLIAQIGPDARLSDESDYPILAVSTNNLQVKNSSQGKIVNVKISKITEHSMFEFIESMLAKMKKIIIIAIIFIALPAVFMSELLINFLMLIVYTILGHALIKAMLPNANLLNTHIMRICVIAITPVLISKAILPQISPLQDGLYFLISMLYLYYGIKSLTVEKA